MKNIQATPSKSRRSRLAGPSCALALLLRLVQPQRAGAEDHVEFKYELYKEDNRRIEVNTGLLQFEKSLTPSLTIRGEMVYDSISGASPTGAPAPAGSKQVPLAQLTEVRRAGSFELSQRWGNHTLTPQVAYSEESDYDSWGISLKDAIDFNNKNTTLSFGAGHNFDTIFAGNSPYLPNGTVLRKDSTDVFLGLTQLLGPKTILTVNGTFGYTDGFLTDPYKGIQFDDFFVPNFIFNERRPGHKSRGVLYASLTQFISPADASVELSYRYYRDSFDISAHTVSLTWLQKIGSHVTVEPFLRYYEQSAAGFYYYRVPTGLGFPVPGNTTPLTPTYYSADYRLSALSSWTCGVKATYRINDHVWLDAAYKRYMMEGKDRVTSASAYPSANIFTLGLTVWF